MEFDGKPDGCAPIPYFGREAGGLLASRAFSWRAERRKPPGDGISITRRLTPLGSPKNRAARQAITRTAHYRFGPSGNLISSAGSNPLLGITLPGTLLGGWGIGMFFKSGTMGLIGIGEGAGSMPSLARGIGGTVSTPVLRGWATATAADRPAGPTVRRNGRPVRTGLLRPRPVKTIHVLEHPAHLAGLFHEQPLAVAAIADDVRRQDDQQFALPLGLRAVAECGANVGEVAQPRHLVFLPLIGLRDQPAQHNRFAVHDRDGRCHRLLIECRREQTIAKADQRIRGATMDGSTRIRTRPSGLIRGVTVSVVPICCCEMVGWKFQAR